MNRVKKVELYLVIDREICDNLGRNIEDVAKDAVASGIDMIQYRDKVADIAQYTENAVKLLDICKKADVPFLVNDYLDIAAEIGADGIHVGQSDSTPESIRAKINREDFILGYSTHTLDQIDEAIKMGVTYFNIGPIYHTNTKKHLTHFLGTNLIKEVASKYPDAVFTTMGGINAINISEVILAGANRVAVVTAIINDKPISDNINYLKSLISKAKEDR